MVVTGDHMLRAQIDIWADERPTRAQHERLILAGNAVTEGSNGKEGCAGQ